MKLPDVNKLTTHINNLALRDIDWNALAFSRRGRVVEVGATMVKAYLPWASMGELCRIEPDGLLAEVVSLRDGYAFLSLFDVAVGLHCGQAVSTSGAEHTIPVGDFLLGKTVDGLGRMLRGDTPPEEGVEWRPLQAAAPDPLKRELINQPLPLGVRALDGLLTCGKGQRLGIFAAAGGGKSTLLSMLCDGSDADILVLALVGERGREVREFLEHTLSAEALARSVIVVATSERPALERLKASFTATTIAEYFRDQGKSVLLMVDSLTRYARAAREVGLASGEPPVAAGFPPSVFATLPRLLERAGPAEVGSITGLYTVLVEGDNMNEPVADEVRSILDGHIILSRKLAEANHYPAIDVGASVSRIMGQITDKEHLRLAGKLRRLMAVYKEIELLVRVGEFQAGQDAEADEALVRWPKIRAFLCQPVDEKYPYKDTLALLKKTVEG